MEKNVGWELYASDPEKQDVEAWGRLPEKVSHRGFLKNSGYAPRRVQTRMTRKRWDGTITWMQNNQGLGEWTPAIRNQIPDYREAVQGLVLPAEESQPRTRRIHEYDYPPNPLKPSLLGHPSTEPVLSLTKDSG